MTNTKTLEKIIEAEHAARENLAGLEEKKKAFAAETEKLIADMRKEAFEAADREIEKEKNDFLKIQSERVERERLKSEKAVESIRKKKETALSEIIEKSFLEITGGKEQNG